MMKRLILFSGMGADSRLMTPIRLADVEVLTPDHIPPLRGESLVQYAGRVAAAWRVQSSDVIGGASFGGMLAAEIAQQRPVAGLLLLGSTLDARRLPRSYPWIERLGHLIPDFALKVRGLRPLLRWRFAPLTDQAEKLLIEMAESCPPSQLRAFGNMIVNWRGFHGADCPVYSIHGERDRVIPAACAEPDLVLKNAGHAFTLTHSAEVSRAVQEFIDGLGEPVTGPC